ncbi:MAG: hypothetical protein V4590_06600 [Bacteroidota bacterium]
MKIKYVLRSLVWIAFIFPFTTQSQSINSGSYHTAIGLRAGGTSGLTVKHFISSGAALEGIIGIWNNAFSITGLYEKHSGTGTAGLNWYYGGGFHVAAENNRYYRNRYYYRDYYSDGGVGIGIDGILGIEYKIIPIPFAISLDVKPFIDVNTHGGAFFSLDPGLGIKFVF